MNEGTTIASVANMNNLIFRGNIDETEVGQLVNGMNMKITIGALQDLKFDAALEYVSPKAVESNGANQFEIKAAVSLSGVSGDSGKSGKLRSGYSAPGPTRCLASLRVPSSSVVTLPSSMSSRARARTRPTIEHMLRPVSLTV